MENTNYVILACKNNQVGELESVLAGEKKLLKNCTPKDMDSASHNAFYYAIRCNNTRLLLTLIDKWPDDYFADKAEELDELLSKAFKELKLKNIALTDEMELFVAEKLINLRFFSDDPAHFKIETSLDNVMERIGFVVETIDFLNGEYFNSEMDEGFLLSARTVAQNIHILKRQLRVTYKNLPWEEIEFCLIIFIRSRILQKTNHFNFVLTKQSILTHLMNFSKALDKEKNDFVSGSIKKLAELPKMTRENVVASIMKENPSFEELYEHYNQLRDLYSLEIIQNCINLALLVDCKEKEGQLIITRALQVIGEHLKNTLESPNLSKDVSDILLYTMPQNTRKIAVDLRNALSHSDSLSMRIDVEEKTDAEFFVNVQNDIKKINIAITDVLHKYKIKAIRKLMIKISQQEDLEELKEILHAVSIVKLETLNVEHLSLKEHVKVEKLIEELDIKIDLKTVYEKDLFKKIYHIIQSEKVFFENTDHQWHIGLIWLNKIKHLITDYKHDEYDIKEIKLESIKALEILNSESRSKAYGDIAELLGLIKVSAMPRLKGEIFDSVRKIFWEIFITFQLEINKVKCIEKLRDALFEKENTSLQRKNITCKQDLFQKLLAFKLSILKSVLNKCGLENKSLKDPQRYTSKKILAIIEMLLLDILSILSTSKNSLTNNLLSLDNDLSVLIGKSLRNHLAHGNALTSVLLVNASTAIFLNARSLISENSLNDERKIGKIMKSEFCLKEKLELDLNIVNLQKRMFNVAKLGDMDNLMICIGKGADIYARSMNSSTILHFAAESSNLSVVKFVYDQNPCVNSEDNKGQTPLHKAAMNGRDNVVSFLLQKDININKTDYKGKTALHVAAENNHKSVVELLLKNKANTSVKDLLGYSPVHYAILYNYIEVSKILLNEEINVDCNQILGGYTPLHLSAEHGHLDLCCYLLKEKANANANNDMKATPLHSAAVNGHLEIVKKLIQYGADVNSSSLNGCTALHAASKGNYKSVIDILLEKGAEVNVFIKTNNLTPLFYATESGHTDVVKTLLKKGAVANITATNGTTPLHAAVGMGKRELVLLFLREGLSIHATDNNGCSALHIGASMNYIKLVRFLIKEGANLEVKENNGQTALHLAAMNGHLEMMEILIEKGASVNSEDKNGLTPLHLCCLSIKLKSLKVLVQKKAKLQSRCKQGNTPLHYAAMKGSLKILEALISAGVDIHVKNIEQCTPLHMAIIGNKTDAVKYLIDMKADLNFRYLENVTPLHLAAQINNWVVCEILIKRGCEVDAIDNTGQTPLCHAIKYNFKQVVLVLLKYNADVNINNGQPLLIAVASGHKDMVQLLLECKNINVNIHEKDISPLYLAASLGHQFIAELLIEKGANVKIKNNESYTALHTAAENGHDEIVKLLLNNKANINASTVDGNTPLHCAAVNGHSNIVKILLNHGAKVKLGELDRSPLELAVAYKHFEVVKVFTCETKVDVNAKGVGQNNWTLLHIAAQSGSLEIVKHLIEKGADIRLKNKLGLRPVHIAAREGYVDIIKYFVSIDELSGIYTGQFQCTPLHYAAIGGHLRVAQFLITECKVDINILNEYGMTPLHVAAEYGHEAVAKFLLNNGAIYNASMGYKSIKPLQLSKSLIIDSWLILTEQLFKAVEQNNYLLASEYVKKGAFINTNNADNISLLHLAVLKGFENIVSLLLKNGADPNIVGKEGCTPLHYASKLENVSVSQLLLSKGATYNTMDLKGKVPLDFATNQDLIILLKLVDESFQSVQNGDSKVFKILSKSSFANIKAVLNASNRNGQTLLVVAIHNNFPEIKELKEVSQPEISSQMNLINTYVAKDSYKSALNIYKKILEKRKEIFVDGSPAILDIQMEIALIQYKQNGSKEALNIFEYIYKSQKRTLGINNKSTLNTQSLIGLIIHDEGKYKEAINILEEVYDKQKAMLGATHPDVLVTLSHMALTFNQLGKYEEALMANQTVYDIYKDTLGISHPNTLAVQNNIAMVLSNLCEYEDALEVYQNVYKGRKDTLGLNHSDTLRTLHNIASVYIGQKKYNEALKKLKIVCKKQENILGINHIDVLRSKCNIAFVLLMQGKFFDSLDIYKNNLSLARDFLSDSHPFILDIIEKIKLVNFRFQFEGDNFANFFSVATG